MVIANRISNIDSARLYALEGYHLSNRIGDVKNIIRSLYLMSLVIGSDNKDSAYFMLNRALLLSKQNKCQDDVPNILYSIALLYQDAGEIKAAMTLLDSAKTIAEKKDQFSMLGQIYNALGNICIEANDSASSLKMYQTAFKIGSMHSDYMVMGVADGNLAQFCRSSKEVIKNLNQAIQLLKKTRFSEEEIAQFSVNAGLAEPDPFKALKWYAQAVEVGRKSHLILPQLGALNNMVYSLLEIGNADSAESCIVNYAIPLATVDKNSDWLATLHDTYADILIHQGNFKKAAENLKTALYEKVVADDKRSVDQVRLLAAIMDTKNREEALEKSNAALTLHKFIVRQQYLAGSAIVLIATVIIMVLLLRNQRRKIKFKTREIELNNRIIDFEEHQTAILGRELHDVISSLMQRLSGHVKNINPGHSAVEHETRKRLEELLASIRTISHRMNKLDFRKSNLRDNLVELSIDMVNLTGINLEMEVPGQLPILSEAMSRNVYRIIQEMLTNAAKYAGDALIKVSLGTVRNKLVIAYQDQGPGFNPLIQTNDGIGLSGIRDRAEIFGGTAQAETSPGNGLSWIISLPLTPGIN